MSRLSTKQRRARRRRREGYQAWLGWQFMASGSLGKAVRDFATFLAFSLPGAPPRGGEGRE